MKRLDFIMWTWIDELLNSIQMNNAEQLTSRRPHFYQQNICLKYYNLSNKYLHLISTP